MLMQLDKSSRSMGFWKFLHSKVGYQAHTSNVSRNVPSFLIENKVKKMVPDYLNLVVVPFVALLLTVILAHTLIGPIGRTIGDGVAVVAKFALT